jgi:three-Cys-motif partner protein
MDNANEFFKEQSEQSYVKSKIVANYFGAWAKVVMGQVKGKGDKIAYIDLYAGPGRYKDSSPSTPLLILNQAINDDNMRKMLIAIFNDQDTDNVESLKKEITSLSGITTLRYQPIVYNITVGREILKIFESVKRVPILCFVDPWGYKGLSLGLISSVLKNWGCDCIFFFNYNRINAGLSNPIVEMHMKSLFGDQRATELKERLEHLNPHQRELAIVEEITKALKAIGGNYVRQFGFKNDQGTRTMHYLIFVTKHVRGYNIMKDIMASASSKFEQGVATFEYNPVDARQLSLFELARPLDDLEDMLLNDFSGRRITIEQIYDEHHIGRKYTEKNYKDAIHDLEAKKKIVADIPPEKRRKHSGKATLKNVIFTFPQKNSH